jgi:AraC-like DNA-binding protein
MKKSNSKYSYKEYKPSVTLKNAVDKIWVFESVDEPGEDRKFGLIPDYTSSIIVITPPERTSLQIFITGPNTNNLRIDNFSEQTTIGFRFYPALLPLMLKTDPVNFTNNSVILKDIIPEPEYNALYHKLLGSLNTRQKISTMNSFILKQLNPPQPRHDELFSVIKKIVSANGNVKLEEIYNSLFISERQFQRKFLKFTGLSPKEFCRIVRFHNVTGKLVKNNFRHFDTLVESGYYDQSHYYREFKEFIGMLPGKFETRQKKISHKKLL